MPRKRCDVPGGEGQPDEGPAYDLGAGVVTGSPFAEALPEPAVGERVAPAAAMPGEVPGEVDLGGQPAARASDGVMAGFVGRGPF
ncbi:hypothetical protein ACFU7Y_30675 [Kitasatospora sp. NPDC057542]|uniref:hypothetical protein n=1 Tax=Kitasatospora sp. NPDC057542 TaxID=3346162 RepID=UPI00369A745B